nr:hypothetical protein CFP56_26517 [Quercus suber]
MEDHLQQNQILLLSIVSSGDGVTKLMNGVAGAASSVGVHAGTGLAATISHPSTSTSYFKTMAGMALDSLSDCFSTSVSPSAPNSVDHFVETSNTLLDDAPTIDCFPSQLPLVPLAALPDQTSIVSSGDGVPKLMNGVASVASSVGVPAGTSLAATISHPSTSTSYFKTMAGMALDSPSDCFSTSVSPSAPNSVDHFVETSNTLLDDAPPIDCFPSQLPLVPLAALPDQTCTSTPEVPPAPIRKLTRTSKPLAYLQDYSCASACSPTWWSL